MRRTLQLLAVVVLALAGTAGLSTPELATTPAGPGLGQAHLEAPEAFRWASGFRVQAPCIHPTDRGGTGGRASHASLQGYGPSSALVPAAVRACCSCRLEFWSADALARAGIASRHATAPPRLHSA